MGSVVTELKKAESAHHLEAVTKPMHAVEHHAGPNRTVTYDGVRPPDEAAAAKAAEALGRSKTGP